MLRFLAILGALIFSSRLHRSLPSLGREGHDTTFTFAVPQCESCKGEPIEVRHVDLERGVITIVAHAEARARLIAA